MVYADFSAVISQFLVEFAVLTKFFYCLDEKVIKRTLTSYNNSEELRLRLKKMRFIIPWKEKRNGSPVREEASFL